MDWTQHTFELDLPLESGPVLPARLRYATAGDRSAPAVLLPSHYMADSTGYDWLVGPGLAVDPARHFCIATELFGNGRSSSPSNQPAPLDGPRFPMVTIRDNVAAQRRLLADLGVARLHAVIGFSMGAQQAFQWAVSHPDVVGRAVATAGTAKTYGHGWVRLEGQLAALRADPAFADGDYTEPPLVGLRAFGAVWAGWLYGQAWWREQVWEQAGAAGPEEALEEVIGYFTGVDANDQVSQVRAWQAHDVGAEVGLEAALRGVRCPVLYLPGQTDLYFPVDDAAYEAQFLPDVELRPIPSLWGHEAGAGASPEDARFLNEVIGAFLSRD
jgi:homoserine O-acetyltransferase